MLKTMHFFYLTFSFIFFFPAVDLVGEASTLDDPMSIPESVTPGPYSTERTGLTQLEIARGLSPTGFPGIFLVSFSCIITSLLLRFSFRVTASCSYACPMQYIILHFFYLCIC